MTYTLYHSPSACSTAAHIVLEEIGAPYELVLISSRGEREGPGTASDEWRAINPKGRIPALATVEGSAGGAPGLLTETVAILFYLAARHPDARLLPDGPERQARCLEWTSFLSGSVHAMACGQVWRAHRFSDDEAALDSIRAKGRANLLEHYAYIERLLEDGRDHPVPGGYSIVDPYLLVFFGWGQRIGIDMRGLYPAWASAMDVVLARPAVKQVLSEVRDDALSGWYG